MFLVTQPARTIVSLPFVAPETLVRRYWFAVPPPAIPASEAAFAMYKAEGWREFLLPFMRRMGPYARPILRAEDLMVQANGLVQGLFRFAYGAFLETINATCKSLRPVLEDICGLRESLNYNQRWQVRPKRLRADQYAAAEIYNAVMRLRWSILEGWSLAVTSEPHEEVSLIEYLVRPKREAVSHFACVRAALEVLGAARMLDGAEVAWDDMLGVSDPDEWMRLCVVQDICGKLRLGAVSEEPQWQMALSGLGPWPDDDVIYAGVMAGSFATQNFFRPGIRWFLYRRRTGAIATRSKGWYASELKSGPADFWLAARRLKRSARRWREKWTDGDFRSVMERASQSPFFSESDVRTLESARSAVMRLLGRLGLQTRPRKVISLKMGMKLYENLLPNTRLAIGLELMEQARDAGCMVSDKDKLYVGVWDLLKETGRWW